MITNSPNTAEQKPPLENEIPDPVLASDPALKPEKGFNEEAYLQQVARGETPFSATEGDNASVKLSMYARALTGHLSRLLSMEKKEVVTLALCHYARCLIHAPTVSLNDLGVQTQGLQLSVQDLVLEVMEFNELTVAVANQEAVSGSSGRS
ncbi:MAG: hypothetical protein Q7T82_11380 [Armatimonadota bacterium]|nr:hypothetical protein [Armatimonadota bacterium]